MRLLCATFVLLALFGCSKSRTRGEAVFEGAVTTPTGQVFTVVLNEKRHSETETEVDVIGPALDMAKPLLAMAGLPTPKFNPPADNTDKWVMGGASLATVAYGAYEMLTKKREQKKRIEAEIDRALRQPPPKDTDHG